ncbi:MAG: HAD family hydrolase [Spirochaetales bacterium]|nr:HAD family hydrolase [Spirochaetales bacterium]
MKQKTLLILDFDGVVCDSLPETLASSWLAYYRFIKNEMPNEMPVDFRRKFHALRPFIRSGEDYIVMQELIAGGKSISSQKEFDDLIAGIGPEQMAENKEVFYQARTELLSSDRDAWLSLNPLFPHMERGIRKQLGKKQLYILSTKKKEFIAEIFHGNDMKFPVDNIIYSGSGCKQQIITSLLDEAEYSHAVFIDDQISHLLDVTDSRIDVRLAEWGYIQQEWLSGAFRVPLITAWETEQLLGSL